MEGAMTQTTDATNPTRGQLSRRQALRLLAGGASALAAGACTPARIVLQAYPEDYRNGSQATQQALLALIDTVVPGLSPEALRSVDVLTDRFYPLARFSDFLASDLDRRARRQHRDRFASLTLDQRTAVVKEALASRDRTIQRLYTGAVFLTEAAVYGGIGDDRAGCALTGFPGGYKLVPWTKVNPAFTARLSSLSRSIDGNPA
jgi:hypothetical protein